MDVDSHMIPSRGYYLWEYVKSRIEAGSPLERGWGCVDKK